MKYVLKVLMMLCIVTTTAHAAVMKIKLTAAEKAAIKKLNLDEASYLKRRAAIAEHAAAEAKRKVAEAKQKELDKAEAKEALKVLGMEETDLIPVSSTAGASAPSPAPRGLSDTTGAFGPATSTAGTEETFVMEYNRRSGKMEKRVIKQKNGANTKSVHSDFKWVTLLDIFMPDKVTGTVRNDRIQLGFSMINDMQLYALGQPAGFDTRSNQASTGTDGWVQYKQKMLALKVQPFEHRRRRETTVMGAPTGFTDVITTNTTTLQLYPLDYHNWSLSLGVGVQWHRYEGWLKNGGTRIPNEGPDCTMVYQVTYWQHLNQFWSMNLGYEFDNVPLTNRFPGIPPVTSTFQGGAFASLVFKPF